MANKPECIIVHHTGVSYMKNPDQFIATNNYHKSLGWGGIGYHYEISRQGRVYKGRDEKVEGAHTYGMNSKSIGIAIDGNFDDEIPTVPQIDALKGLLIDLCKRYNIPADKIYPHRKFANKTCYGKRLDEKWASSLVAVKENYDAELAKRLDKMFLLSVEESGKLYYVANGKRMAIPARMTVEQFVTENGIYTGINLADLNKIKPV